jgi:hypothetical protein
VAVLTDPDMSMKVFGKSASVSSVLLLQTSHLGILIARVVSAMLIVALTSSAPASQAQSQTPNEYQIKAAFLYKFARFVQWPAEAFGENSTSLIVGVLGEDPFGSDLDQTVSGKTINGLPFTIKRLKWGQDLRACHILFIGSSERKRLPQIIASLKGASVLTVGEMGQFTQQGGIVNFTMEENNVRFEINAEAAGAARLRISSRLLSLAKPAGGGH